MVVLLGPQELRQVAERQGDGSEEAFRTPQPPSGKMAYSTSANGEQPGVSNKPNSVDVLKCAHAVAEAAQVWYYGVPVHVTCLAENRLSDHLTGYSTCTLLDIYPGRADRPQIGAAPCLQGAVEPAATAASACADGHHDT